jgi:hypothetical protein
MKANELRIGNYVNEWSAADKKYYVDKIDVDLLRGIIEDWTECQPIPLTEEWLLKFGFEKNVFNRWVHWNFDLLLHEDGEWFESDELPMFIFLKHVHQLQNLYFALTGEELTLKEL